MQSGASREKRYHSNAENQRYVCWSAGIPGPDWLFFARNKASTEARQLSCVLHRERWTEHPVKGCTAAQTVQQVR